LKVDVTVITITVEKAQNFLPESEKTSDTYHTTTDKYTLNPIS